MGWTSLDCPECFPAEQEGAAEEAGWRSYGVGFVEQDCAPEPKPETWPATKWKLLEVGCAFLCEVVAAVVVSER